MGASGKWVKAITGQRKPDKDDDNKVRRKPKKWGLWRSSSSDIRRCSSGGSNGSSPLVDAFSAAMAKVVRAPPKDFKAVRQEWAAIRIQTAFRGFLARRALRALKGIVRIQALVRGRQVRKKAAVTLRCMQALVRVQARVRARHVRMSVEGQAVQRVLDEHRTKADLLKQAEQGWCDSKATIEDIKVTIQMKQVGAFKRERAMAYSLAHKQLNNIDTKSRSNTSAPSIGNYKIDKNSWGWSWLERWMAARPWETQLMDKPLSEITPTSKLRVEYSPLGANSKSLEQIAVKVKKNNVTTRISARPPMTTHPSSSPSSDHRYDESSASPSFCTSATPNTTSDRTTVESCGVRPSYMNLTQSMKAKQKNSYLSHRGQRQQSMDEFQFMKNTAGLSYTDSINFSRPLNKSAQLESNLKDKKRENFLYY